MAAWDEEPLPAVSPKLARHELKSAWPTTPMFIGSRLVMLAWPTLLRHTDNRPHRRLPSSL